MSKESNSGNTGSDAFLELKDIISLNREFDSLCKNLETVQNKVVDEWAWQCAEVVKNSSKDFEKNAASYKDEIEQIRKKISDQNMRAAEMREVGEKLNQLEKIKNEIESGMTEQQKKINIENERLQECTKDVEALEKVTVAKKEKVHKALAYFKGRTGLRFQTLKAEEQIKVIFSKIDENDINKEFSFNTKIVDSKYIISECEPPVDQLDQYVEELNKSNDYGRFVIKMRKAFKNNLMGKCDQNTPVNLL